MELKQRAQKDPAYQWDLTAIYENDAAWERAMEKAAEAVKELKGLPGTLGASAQALADGLDKIYAASALVERAYIYATLRRDGDNGDARGQEMSGKSTTLYVEFSTNTAFLEPEILAIDEKTLAEYLKEERLATYRHLIGNIVRGRAHVLGAEQEKMLAMLSDAAGGFRKSFSMLESVDMSFPAITDEAGESVTLSHGNFAVYRESRDQRVRKEAFEAYFGEFKRYINTFAALYEGSVKMDCYYAKVRGFDGACEAALFGTNVPIAVYDALTDAVHDAFPTMQRYLALRKKQLGVKELHMYDLYCPMVENVDISVPFADAKTLVKKALAPLGEEYAKLLDRAFAEKWIDVYENKGKTTGAFSCGVFGVHPYVLLNYTDTLDDAFTLAHELGHSMHSYFSDHTQDYVNHDYEIMVAEVASTVNEVLLTKHLLSVETDPARRAYILNHFLEGFRTTVFRQTLFAEFEREAHKAYDRGEPLTPKALNAIYRRLNEAYYKGAVVDELQDIEWARIPHFYNAFYVYQYATGFSSAVAIANNILQSGSAENYLRFLTTGGSDYPLNELRIAGVDLEKPDTVRNAMQVFAQSLDELEALLH